MICKVSHVIYLSIMNCEDQTEDGRERLTTTIREYAGYKKYNPSGVMELKLTVLDSLEK